MKKLLVLPLLFLFFGCATPDEGGNTPDALFKRAQHLEEDERFEEAISKYDELRNRFPYSKLSTQAELQIAGIHYKREDFTLAAAAYNNFRELHPTHSEIPYVVYQIGNSYYYNLPTTIDRDISDARVAIKEFENLVKKYPSYAKNKDAQEKTTKCYEMMAEKEMYIGHFYFLREQFLSAMKRFEGVLKIQSSDKIKRDAFYHAGLSALEINERPKAKDFLQTLINRFPTSEEAGQAKSVLSKNGLL